MDLDFVINCILQDFPCFTFPSLATERRGWNKKQLRGYIAKSGIQQQRLKEKE